jgi:hypothetical protein
MHCINKLVNSLRKHVLNPGVVAYSCNPSTREAEGGGYCNLCYRVLEVPFPNSDQRNTQQWLNKAKRKVVLLQKDAAADHSLKGRTHLDGKSTRPCPVALENWSTHGLTIL